MYRLSLVVAVLLVLGLPAAAAAQEAGTGTISGQVINGTAGGGSVAGVAVTLITYTGAETATRTARTDRDGRFRFDNIAIEHEYVVSARYMGVDYYYPVTFAPGETAAQVEVGVCDTTTSDQAIRVGLAHTIITVAEEGLQVTQVCWLVNDGDRTYIGNDGVIVFTLPAGATGVDAPAELMADYQLRGDNRLAHLVPFPPGERQLVYSYWLDRPDSDEINIPVAMDYPTDHVEVMVQGEGVEVAAAGLAPAEPVVTGGGERFLRFRGESIPRGTVINICLTHLSAGGGVPFTILWVAAALLAAGGAAYLLKRRGGSHG